MADTTLAARRRRLGVPDVDTRPRPLRQGLWILASVAVVGLTLVTNADQIGRTGVDATAGIEAGRGDGGAAAQLIEMSDDQVTGSAPVATEVSPEVSTSLPTALAPAAPTAGSAAASIPAHLSVGHDALSEISYPWQELLPGWEIEFLDGRDGLFGLTLVPERRIEVYVRPDQSPSMVAHVVAHELGHAVDVTLNDGDDRRRWAELRGIDAPWWPESGATDFSTGAGDFAESFAAWQVGPAGFRSTLADAPDGAELELLAQLSAD